VSIVLVVKNEGTEDVLIEDLGFTISGESQEQVNDLFDIRSFLLSENLRQFALAGTLKLNDGTSDIPVSEVDDFIQYHNTGPDQAHEVAVDATEFSGHLGTGDSDVQAALRTLDQLPISGVTGPTGPDVHNDLTGRDTYPAHPDSALSRSVQNKSDNYTMVLSDFGTTLRFTNSTQKTLTLYSLSGTETGREVEVIRTGTGSLLLAVPSGYTLYFLGVQYTGAATVEINEQWRRIQLRAISATEWEASLDALAFNEWSSEVSDDGESTTTSQTLQTKLSHTTEELPAGKYRVGYGCEYGNNIQKATEVTVEVEGSTVALVQSSVTEGDYWNPFAGFYYYDLAADGTITVDLKYRNLDTGGTARIRCARIEVWRVE